MVRVKSKQQTQRTQQSTRSKQPLGIGYGYIYQGYYIYALVPPDFVLEGDLAHGLVHLLLFFSMNEYTVPQPPFGPKPARSLINSSLAVVFPAATMVER
jgi:hypothetical protein